MTDERTLQMVDNLFGDKFTISLTRFAKATGFHKSTLEQFIASGALSALCTGTHVRLTRPMVVQFLTRGGSLGIHVAPVEYSTTRAKRKRVANLLAARYRQRPIRAKKARKTGAKNGAISPSVSKPMENKEENPTSKPLLIDRS